MAAITTCVKKKNHWWGPSTLLTGLFPGETLTRTPGELAGATNTNLLLSLDMSAGPKPVLPLCRQCQTHFLSDFLCPRA